MREAGKKRSPDKFELVSDGELVRGLPSEVIQIDPLAGGSDFFRCGGFEMNRA